MIDVEEKKSINLQKVMLVFLAASRQKDVPTEAGTGGNTWQGFDESLATKKREDWTIYTQGTDSEAREVVETNQLGSAIKGGKWQEVKLTGHGR